MRRLDGKPINYNPKSALNLVRGFKNGMVPWNKGIKYSDELKKKIHPWIYKVKPPWNKGIEWPRMQGENSPVWVKDRSSLARRNGRGDNAASIVWARQVKKRDSWKCRMENGYCDGNLEAHHIFSVKDFPEKRYEVENGVTLCHKHHPRKREEEKIFRVKSCSI